MRQFLSRAWRALRRRLPGRARRKQQCELDSLYRILYNLAHDCEQAVDQFATQTTAAFEYQWKTLPQGQYVLSDPWFKANVTDILTRQELLIDPAWFKGKRVLDAGCGNGRWSYGLTKLGAQVTAVDYNAIAIEETRRALAEQAVEPHFHQSPLEELENVLPPDDRFDLVFCWGVAHHCRSFNEAIRQLCRLVKDGGVLYLYLYGRESIPFDDDLELFKERVRYNVLPTPEAKLAFLREKAGGDEQRIHNMHDIYAPLINRRLSFDAVKAQLELLGLHRVERTIDHTELFIRAFKGDVRAVEPHLLAPASPPYWFEHHGET